MCVCSAASALLRMSLIHHFIFYQNRPLLLFIQPCVSRRKKRKREGGKAHKSSPAFFLGHGLLNPHTHTHTRNAVVTSAAHKPCQATISAGPCCHRSSQGALQSVPPPWGESQRDRKSTVPPAAGPYLLTNVSASPTQNELLCRRMTGRPTFVLSAFTGVCSHARVCVFV